MWPGSQRDQASKGSPIEGIPDRVGETLLVVEGDVYARDQDRRVEAEMGGQRQGAVPASPPCIGEVPRRVLHRNHHLQDLPRES